MTDITALTDKKGYIKISALDHRDSLRKILSEDEIVKFKSLCVKTFSPFVTAVLLDPEYLENVKERFSIPLITSLEKSGYKETPEGRQTELYGDYFDSKTAKRIGASATKLLLYYNSEAPIKHLQIALAKRCFLESHGENLPLLLEIVTYPFQDKVYNESLEIKRGLEDLLEFGDILKINYCEDIQVLSELKYLSKPWVLLSRGREFNDYKKCLVNARAIGGASGFAAGRALWQEVGNLKSWNKKEDFVKSIVVSRLKELAEVFED